MKLPPLVVFALACIAGAIIGWVASIPPRAGAVGPALRVSVPAFEREGVQLAMAAGQLRAMGLAAPPVSTEADEAVVAETDIAAEFRRDLTAIVRGPTGTVVWLVDSENRQLRRALRRGGVYRDEWRLAAVRDQEIVLRREGEELRVPIVGPAPAEQQ